MQLKMSSANVIGFNFSNARLFLVCMKIKIQVKFLRMKQSDLGLFCLPKIFKVQQLYFH